MLRHPCVESKKTRVRGIVQNNDSRRFARLIVKNNLEKETAFYRAGESAVAVIG